MFLFWFVWKFLFLFLLDTDRKATVSGFTSDFGKPMTVRVVNAAVAYECNVTGKVQVLVICNVLYFRNMKVNLIPPFMMPLAGIKVHKCPKFLAKEPTERNHSMYFPEADIRILFQLEGIISYLPTRIPTKQELEEQSGSYLLLIPNMPKWNPHTEIYRDQEFGMMDYNGNIERRRPDTNLRDRNVFDREIASVKINEDPAGLMSAVKTLREICIGGYSPSTEKERLRLKNWSLGLKYL